MAALTDLDTSLRWLIEAVIHANINPSSTEVSGLIDYFAALDTSKTANDAHADGDGSDHADVVTNSAHVAGDGSDHADVAANTAAVAQITAALNDVRWPMAVYGTWGIDVDGANTNGGGLVGADATLAEQSAAYCKVEDNAVFANAAVASGEAGYTADYQLFPDAPVAGEDFAYFGAAVPFPEAAFDLSQAATHDALAVHEWTYWDGATWSALTLNDNTEATVKDGSEAFERSGAITFVPPADWASTTVDGQAGYWIRIGIAAGKAANLTQLPILNSKEHELVTPADGFLSPDDGSITGIRLSDGASTLHTAADVKLMLVNYTTGAHSGELTFPQDKRTDQWTGLSLAVAAGDELGVVCTQEDGTNEVVNAMLELAVNYAL